MWGRVDIIGHQMLAYLSHEGSMVYTNDQPSPNSTKQPLYFPETSTSPFLRLASCNGHRRPYSLSRRPGRPRDMQQAVAVILFLFAIPISFMSWILWKFSREIGDLPVRRRPQRLHPTVIQIQPERLVRISTPRNPRSNMPLG